MSKCGYYSCFKGKPACKHPEKGELMTKSGIVGRYCDLCKRSCGGVYPSELPRVKFTDIEVVDKDGNVIG